MNALSDVVKLSHDQKIFDILENAARIPASGPLPEQYDIQAYKLCLDRNYIYIGGSAHGLTNAGSELHWLLVGNLFAVRSQNNNVFKYCSYWGSWSRVLWHESDQKLRSSIGFDARASSFIELDLTAVNSDSKLHWESHTQHANIRTHCTAIGPNDKFTMTLPGRAVYRMREWLTEDAVQKLIHADYLPYIDFEKGRKASNGGFKFVDAQKEYMTISLYLANYRRSTGAGDSLLVQDVREDYEYEKQQWELKRNALIIHKGMRDAED